MNGVHVNAVHYNEPHEFRVNPQPSRPPCRRHDTGPPPKLDQARTVEAALALLDEVGLDALTMRRLAEAMDVRAGALYRYFATKHELLTAMAEVLLADCLDRPLASPDWSERLAELARRMRTALLGRRDGARVYAGTYSTGSHTLGFADTLVGVLREAGFSPRTRPVPPSRSSTSRSATPWRSRPPARPRATVLRTPNGCAPR